MIEDSWIILVAMGYMCRVAYHYGLDGFTDDERKILQCYNGFDPKYLPPYVPKAAEVTFGKETTDVWLNKTDQQP